MGYRDIRFRVDNHYYKLSSLLLPSMVSIEAEMGETATMVPSTSTYYWHVYITMKRNRFFML